MKKLLCVSAIPPFPILNGASLRLGNFLSFLKRDWEIDLICPAVKGSVKDRLNSDFNAAYFCNTQKEAESLNRIVFSRVIRDVLHVRRFKHATNAPFLDRIQFRNIFERVLRDKEYDAIFVSGAMVFANNFRYYTKFKIICDVCDSNSRYLFSVFTKSFLKGPLDIRQALSSLTSLLYQLRWEKKFLMDCTRLIVISRKDKEFLQKTMGKKRISIVNNGVDVNYWRPDIAKPGKSPGLIVFTGIMGYAPNHDAMMYCMQRIWPIIKTKISFAKLRIVGRYPQKELIEFARNLKDIEITGEVDDVRSSVEGAGLFICPMRFGSGMKNKVLESLAMGIPVVTTKEGCAGIPFSHGQIGYIGRDEKELADFAVKIILSNEIRSKMSLAAREFAVKKFSWEHNCHILSRILSD